MLRVLDNSESLEKGFSLSAPAKIAGKAKLSFGLPAGPDFSCPGATTACNSCYAQKGNFTFKAPQLLLANNWVRMKQYESAEDLSGAASELLAIISENAPIFRIHHSGDFHSQFAIDMWTKIATARPSTKFYFYTRSFTFDYSSFLALSNVTGWASCDEYNETQAKAWTDKNPNTKLAYGPWNKDNPIPENSFVCPVTSKKMDTQAACVKCKLCTDKSATKRSVVFFKH